MCSFSAWHFSWASATAMLPTWRAVAEPLMQPLGRGFGPGVGGGGGRVCAWDADDIFMYGEAINSSHNGLGNKSPLFVAAGVSV